LPGLLIGAILFGPIGTVCAEGGALTAEEHERLVQLFYDRLGAPNAADVTFIREVQLISSVPDCQRSSQYWTGLVVYGRLLCRSTFLERLEQTVREWIDGDADLKSLPRDARRELMFRVLGAVLGPLVEAEIPEDLASNGSFRDFAGRSVRLVRRGADGVVVTPGMDALRTVDARLRATRDIDAELVSLLRTRGVRWRVLRRKEVRGEECTRLLSRRVPFVAHRGETDYMVCGFASDHGTTYLMSFDVAKSELQVVLGGGATSVPYSRFLAIEREAKARDPNITFDPHFGDYKAYFSRKNLPGFRLLPLRESEIISVLDPEDLDADVLRDIVRAEAEVTRKKLAEAQAKKRK